MSLEAIQKITANSSPVLKMASAPNFKLVQLPWWNTFQRFLTICPTCADDELLLNQIIQLLRLLIRCEYSEDMVCWVAGLLTAPKGVFVQILSCIGEDDYGLVVSSKNLSQMFPQVLYSVRGLERSELGGSHGCPWTDFYDRSTRTIVGTMLRTEYRSVIKIGPKGALGSHEIHPIHSAPSLGQSIVNWAWSCSSKKTTKIVKGLYGVFHWYESFTEYK